MRFPLTQILPMCLIALALSHLAGCSAPIQTTEFGKFERSVASMQSSTHDLFGEIAADARRGLVDGKEFGATFKPSELKIERKESFDYSTDARTLESMLREMRSGLFDLNVSLKTYAASLNELAGGGDADAARIEQLAAQLNANLQEASKSVNGFIRSRGGTGQDLSAQATGVVSTIAAAALEAHIEHMRRESLRRVMSAGQATVGEAAALGQLAVKTAATDAYAIYTQWFQSTFNDSYNQRRKTVDDLVAKRDAGNAVADEIRLIREIQDEMRIARAALLDRNDELANTFDALGELYAAYGKLPEAHATLRGSLDKKMPTFESLREFYAQIERMQRLYKNVTPAN
jgi:hypothetical protein